MIWLLSMWACSSSYVLEATIEDALGAGHLGGFDVVAKADDPSVTLSCRTLQGRANDEGVLTIANLCPGTSYTLTVRADVVVPELETVADGGPGGPITVKGYQAPAGEGQYLISKGELSILATNADQKREVPQGAAEPVLFPGATPPRVPVVAHGDYLLLAGEGMELQLAPLVANPSRLELEEGPAMKPWSYVGVSFEGNVPTPQEVTVDASKVTEVTVAGRSFRYLAADAVPAGRYVLYRPGERRLTLLDMGGPATLP